MSKETITVPDGGISPDGGASPDPGISRDERVIRKKTAVFLQVRLASSRLPEKALLPLAGKPVVLHAMDSLRSLPVEQFWLVTDEESAPLLEPWARKGGFRVFAGDARDVLLRFCQAADHTGAEVILRATGDNPLVSRKVALGALDLFFQDLPDYAALRGSPLGTGVEVIRSEALDDLRRFSSSAYDHEHVTPGLYENPQRYRLSIEEVPRQWQAPSWRVTLDTPEDYQALQSIYDELYRGSPIALEDLLAFGYSRVWYSA
ncbi:spore coat polysaccharide biosynthesis protein SpsF [Alkalispirochaeta americana]|uniref:Spore coat polysaccharide biosynthesis protein SpsF n=1 Tax=Alkalispirochaeta americana TaxID=159291 RepID=A0A1N6PAY6_9SPIO|nr:NTP transferase domain-containing protein [Alkalispirochaeta americana]SIQ01504.1 spore coat polysaccharide biosynthesis protein SpsF [Alkalispirochaeta americana]